jgi:Tol biopolymer transport system component
MAADHRARPRQATHRRVAALAIGLLLVLLLLSAGGSAAASHPTPAGLTGRESIVFDTVRSCDEDCEFYSLWTLRPGTKKPRRLGSGYGRNPVWSPDGKQIAFTDFHGVYLMRPDGTGKRRLAGCQDLCAHLSWRPGTHELIVEDSGPAYRVYVVDARTGKRRPFLSGTDRSAISWSPDGRRLAYDWNSIHVMNVDGSGDRVVAPSSCRRPAWSPDGRWIAVSCWVNSDRTGIWSMHPDGSALRPLITAVHKVPDAYAWSPDSRRLAYFDWVDEINFLVIHDLRTGNSERVRTPTGEGENLDWRAARGS